MSRAQAQQGARIRRDAQGQRFLGSSGQRSSADPCGNKIICCGQAGKVKGRQRPSRYLAPAAASADGRQGRAVPSHAASRGVAAQPVRLSGCVPARASAKIQCDLVPMLRVGLPVRLIAAVHDRSVVMVEQRYLPYIVDATEELLRRAAIFGPCEDYPFVTPALIAARAVADVVERWRMPSGGLRPASGSSSEPRL